MQKTLYRMLAVAGVSLGLLAISALLYPTHATSSLTQITYLGKGGTYTIPSADEFIVKRVNPFRFNVEDVTDYDATRSERVWQSDGNGFLAQYHEWRSFGDVEEDCVISYVAIDDDVDERRNKWYIDGEKVHTMPQGMVVYDSFTADDDGELELYAGDSIGAKITVECPEPTPTITPTPTNTPTPTPTSTPSLTPTPTVTPSITPDPTPTPTPVIVNSSVTVEKTVRVTGAAGLESPTLWAEVAHVVAGNTIEFAIKITNTGESTIGELFVLDVLPSNLGITSVADNWTITNFASGSEETVYIAAHVNDNGIANGNEKCVVNVVNVMIDSNKAASDTADVCITNKPGEVLPTIIELPKTGTTPMAFRNIGMALAIFLTGGAMLSTSKIFESK